MRKNCIKCGGKLNSDSKFCPKCGATTENIVKKQSKIRKKKIVRTGIIFGITVVLAGAFVVAQRSQKKIVNRMSDETGGVQVKEVKENEQSTGEFNITDEQATFIQFASELFDYSQRKKDGYDSRKEYTLDLKNKNVLTDILNEVASGIIYVDKSTGIEKIGPNGIMQKEIEVQECQNLLKNTFGYQAKQSDIKNNFGQTMNGDIIEINYIDPYEEHTIYETRRFAQTKEDEYHFYTEVKVKQEMEGNSGYQGFSKYRTVGIMDITAHKNSESKIGGYIFEKIDFQLDDGNGLNYEIDNILNQLVRSQIDMGLEKDSKIIENTYEIDKLSDKEFQCFATYVITSTNLADSRKLKVLNGVFDGYTVSKDEYEEICKEMIGKSGNVITDETEEVDGKIHIKYISGESDFQTQNSRIIQNLNGTVSLKGIMSYDSLESLGVEFSADGYTNEKSKVGITIKSITLKGRLNSKNVSKLTKEQEDLIKKRLGVPEFLDATVDTEYIGVRTNTYLRMIDVNVLVNHESVAEAEVDAISGEFAGAVLTYKIEEDNSVLPSNEIFTKEQIAFIKQQLGVPDSENIIMTVSDSPYYWETGECTLVNVTFTENGEIVAGADVNVDTAECTTSLYTYTPKG